MIIEPQLNDRGAPGLQKASRFSLPSPRWALLLTPGESCDVPDGDVPKPQAAVTSQQQLPDGSPLSPGSQGVVGWGSFRWGGPNEKIKNYLQIFASGRGVDKSGWRRCRRCGLGTLDYGRRTGPRHRINLTAIPDAGPQGMGVVGYLKSRRCRSVLQRRG